MNDKLTLDTEHLRDRVHQYGKLKSVTEFKDLFMLAVATMPYAFVVNRMLVPHAIVGGGLTGLCEIIYFATGTQIPIWLSTLVLDAILLIIAIYTVGWKFCVRTIYGVLWLAFWLRFVPIPQVADISDPFMAVVLGGLFAGLALGLVFLNNGSTGGTDIIAMIVNKFRHLPMGRGLFYCDLIIISCAYFLPEVHSIEKVLFGLCFTFISAMAVDWVMNRTRQSVQFFIFSQHYQEIADAIMTQVPRGVTILDGIGGYSKQPVKVVTVLARKNESDKIFRLVRMIDPNAFVSQSLATGVFGQGFDSIKDRA